MIKHRARISELERIDLASTRDSNRHLMRISCRHDEYDVLWRLLERFKQRIERAGRQHVRLCPHGGRGETRAEVGFGRAEACAQGLGQAESAPVRPHGREDGGNRPFGGLAPENARRAGQAIAGGVRAGSAAGPAV